MATHFGKNAKNYQFQKGTTTLGFIYEPATSSDKGGVIVAVDSRASAGQYIGKHGFPDVSILTLQHLQPSTRSSISMTRWLRPWLAEQLIVSFGFALLPSTASKLTGSFIPYLRVLFSLFELREKMDITVAATSKYFANVMYGWRGYGLSVVGHI